MFRVARGRAGSGSRACCSVFAASVPFISVQILRSGISARNSRSVVQSCDAEEDSDVLQQFGRKLAMSVYHVVYQKD
ncbi:hypothetical protein SCHPADRAFT_525029 [Schizopora paradoxa]|uniref:Uncharacterized protein n=1 Tax=Schizopora paradoxa TaxID=27342 RepID=A0A0H2REQ5_9AGAM|nr:hypothetical protein SCHPADRAFT_525029 [Schizopora paradoxa]